MKERYTNLIKAEYGMDRELIRMAVYPVGTTDETYYILYELGGKMVTLKGVRKNMDITRNTHLIIEGKKFTQIDQYAIEELERLLIKMDENEFNPINKMEILDGWETAIIRNGKTYVYNYNEYPSNNVKKLIQLLLDNAAIPVDIHDWT